MTIPDKYAVPAVGTSGIWQRCQNASIDNTNGAVQRITFNENKLASVNGEIIPGPGVTDPIISATLDNPATVFISADGTPWTYQQYADAVIGLYFSLAIPRDAKMVADAAALEAK